MSDPLVSYLIITYNRKEDLGETLLNLMEQTYTPKEIIIVDNNSNDGTENFIKEKFTLPGIHYIRSSKNLGVSGGRNVAIEAAKGDILITIDDDAVFASEDSTKKIVDKFLSDPSETGILAFKVVDYYTGALQKDAYPKREKSTDPDKEFETTWFIGAGHAIKKEVLEKVGLYRDFAPWGSEELDFSFRALDAEYLIKYFPRIIVKHKISQTGRIANQTQFKALALKHRLKAAALNLPWSYVMSYSAVRSLQFFIKTRGNIIVVLKAHYWFLLDLPYILKNRKKISPLTVQKIHNLKGPIYF